MNGYFAFNIFLSLLLNEFSVNVYFILNICLCLIFDSLKSVFEV